MDPGLLPYYRNWLGYRPKAFEVTAHTYFFIMWISWHHRSLFLVLNSRRQDLIAILISSSCQNKKLIENMNKLCSCTDLLTIKEMSTQENKHSF